MRASFKLDATTQTALKQPFISSTNNGACRRRSRPLRLAENVLAHSKCNTQTTCSHLVTLSSSFTSSSSLSLIPQIIIPCLTSHTVLSLEQTAHPHRHGNSGTTAGSLVLLGVGHLNHSFPSSCSLSLTLLFTFIHFLHTDLLWRPCQ